MPNFSGGLNIGEESQAFLIVHIDVAPVSNGDCLRSQAEMREGISVR
jgi:hypothetical protein